MTLQRSEAGQKEAAARLQNWVWRDRVNRDGGCGCRALQEGVSRYQQTEAVNTTSLRIGALTHSSLYCSLHLWSSDTFFIYFFFFLTWKIKRRGVNETSGESSCMPACDYQWPRHSHGRTSSSASVGLWMLNNFSCTFKISLAQLHHRHHHHSTHSLFCNLFPAGYSASLWLMFVDFLLLCAV